MICLGIESTAHTFGVGIIDDEGKIKSISILNYGGERRLREVNSSLRWTLDKMYDKVSQG